MRTTSHLVQPTLQLSYTERPRLYQQLSRWKALRAIIVRAPAGYGKSSLISHWVSLVGEHTPTAWVSLDERAAAPVPFIGWLAEALEYTLPGVSSSVQAILEHASPEPERALSYVLDAIADLRSDIRSAEPKHVLLVLDDLHLANNPAVNHLLRQMLLHGPANLHLCLISRAAIDLPLARLYAQGQVIEIGIEDLRFTAAELRDYLVLRGYTAMTEGDLAEIRRRCDGWITALQIAILGQRTSGDVRHLIADLKGDSRWLAAYLNEEVLAQQPATIRRFLLCTAILTSFNAELAAAVSELPDTAQLLQQIKAGNLFLIGLDHRDEWFRYHHLFQEWLLQVVHAEMGKPSVQALHRRAAAWYAQCDEIPAAIGHLGAADDEAAAAELLAERLPALILRDPYRARSWLDLAPAGRRATDPTLLLLRCRIECLHDNRELLTYVGQAERATEAADLPVPQAAALRAELLVWRIVAHFLRGNLADAQDCLQQSWADPTPLDDFAAATREFITMHLHNHAGRHVEAMLYADRALAIFTRKQYHAGIIAIRREIAKHAFRLGKSVEANHQVQLIVRENYTGTFVARELLMTYIFAIQNSYWQNDLAQARHYCEQGSLLARRLQDEQLLSTVIGLEALCAPDPGAANQTAHPHDVPVLTDTRQLRVVLQIQLLLRARRVEEAWHLAESLDVDLRCNPATRTNAVLLGFFQAYIARGLNLAALTALLKHTLERSTTINDRYSELWLLTLRAWQQLKLNRRRDALKSLDTAIRLALSTGYIRIILEIPDLQALIDQNAPAASQAPASSDKRLAAEIVLTAQEQTILHLLAQDYRYEQIARELTISINTVQTHIRNLYTKLGVSRRAQALVRAKELSIF